MTAGATGDELRKLLTRSVESGIIPGAVAMIGGPDAVPVAVGTQAVGGAAMPPDAIMRIQSMTKAVTAVAALRAVAAGRIALDDSIEPWLPELADRRVLVDPGAALADTVAAGRPITLRQLLTNTSGLGMQLGDTPLAAAMVENGTAAGPEPVALGAQEWLNRLADLPLAFAPGDGWRYHHSFAVLGILLARLTGRPLGDHLADDVFEPLGMVDTAFWVPAAKAGRLPAAYRHDGDGLVETEPTSGGFYVGPPPFDVSHSELVSTVGDYHRFLMLLTRGGLLDGTSYLSAEHLELMTHDQVPATAKAADSFFPGFWDGTGWGFGVAVTSGNDHRGRYGWSGGQGTDLFVDPDGTVGILFTQVELGGAVEPLLTAFQALV